MLVMSSHAFIRGQHLSSYCVLQAEDMRLTCASRLVTFLSTFLHRWADVSTTADSLYLHEKNTFS